MPTTSRDIGSKIEVMLTFTLSVVPSFLFGIRQDELFKMIQDEPHRIKSLFKAGIGFSVLHPMVVDLQSSQITWLKWRVLTLNIFTKSSSN
jgi:hypothetical protein